jgi:hypothetical protein
MMHVASRYQKFSKVRAMRTMQRRDTADFENACLLLARVEGPHPHRNLDIVGHRWALLRAGALVPARTRCRKDAQTEGQFKIRIFR